MAKANIDQLAIARASDWTPSQCDYHERNMSLFSQFSTSNKKSNIRKERRRRRKVIFLVLPSVTYCLIITIVQLNLLVWKINLQLSNEDWIKQNNSNDFFFLLLFSLLISAWCQTEVFAQKMIYLPFYSDNPYLMINGIFSFLHKDQSL